MNLKQYKKDLDAKIQTKLQAKKVVLEARLAVIRHDRAIRRLHDLGLEYRAH